MRAAGIVALAVLASGCQALGITTTASRTGRAAAAPACPERLDLDASLVAVPFPLRRAVQVVAKSGLVAVRYRRAGCDVSFEVLEGCKVVGRYAWRAEAVPRSEVLRTPAELRDRLDLSAGVLESKRSAKGGLRVDERVVGRWLAPRQPSYARARLEGACEGATHVLTAIELGGYAVTAGAPSRLEGLDGFVDHAVPGVDLVSRAGDEDKCRAPATSRAPKGCDEPLEVRLAAIAEGEAPAPLSSMVRIPAGTFTMGSDTAAEDARPRHQVRLNAFEIDRMEVTVDAYRKCVDAGKCKPASEGPRCNGAGKEDHPVNCVSFDDAEAFCKWSDKRLPTEAEWERAARGVDGRSFPWGEAWPPPASAGNFADETGAEASPNWAQVPGYVDGFPFSAPVGTFRAHATPEGVLDVVGNVAEWVADIYDARIYAEAARVNPRGPRRGSGRVVRGGAYGHARPEQLRVSARAFYVPETRSQHIGFRCARDAAAK